LAVFIFLWGTCVAAAVLGLVTILVKQRHPGWAGAIVGAVVGATLSSALIAACLGLEEIDFTAWSVAGLIAVLAFLSGKTGFSASTRMYDRDVPSLGPGRYHGQSLFAWVMLFELPVMLIAGLFRLLQSIGLFR
jgi:hypothetical protein